MVGDLPSQKHSFVRFHPQNTSLQLGRREQMERVGSEDEPVRCNRLSWWGGGLVMEEEEQMGNMLVRRKGLSWTMRSLRVGWATPCPQVQLCWLAWPNRLRSYHFPSRAPASDIPKTSTSTWNTTAGPFESNFGQQLKTP